MNLDEAQKQRVAAWLNEGLKLSDIQKRLASELGINLTYMEVRLLVDDLRLTPKDVEPAKPADLTRPANQSAQSSAAVQPGVAPDAAGTRSAGGVSLQVDQVTRPGAVVSGQVTFSDGKSADWYLDQMGRLGLMPKEQGYRPSQTDVMAFQAELQNELARLGL